MGHDILNMLDFQTLHDTVCCFVFTMEPLGRVKTKHLGVFLVRLYIPVLFALEKSMFFCKIRFGLLV